MAVVAPAPVRAPEDGRRPYQARGAALELWKCRDEAILLDGPAGTGKTRAILEKAHYCALKYAGCRILLIRKTRESMTTTVLVTFELKVLPSGSPILKGPQRKLRSSYFYPNGSEIVVGGMDNPVKVMSSEYDMICMFESTEFTQEEYETLTTRNRNFIIPYQQVLLDCNPGGPSHWLNKMAGGPLMRRFLSRHEDNPVLFRPVHVIKQRSKRIPLVYKKGRKKKPEVPQMVLKYELTDQGKMYIGKLDRLTGSRYKRLRLGKWVAAEGMVFGEWAPAIHLKNKKLTSLTPADDIPKEWRRIRVIDFGYNNPFVCQWWAIDHDGNMYLYREIYFSHRLVKDHAWNIIKLSEGEKYEVTVADHDLEGRETLHGLGIYTDPAYKDVERGIDAVKTRLRIDETTHKARLYVYRDCTVEYDELLTEAALPVKTADEFDGYVYKKVKDGQAVKEEPVKKDDHGMDAMRYAVAYVDNLAGMMVQVETEEALVVA